LNVIVALSNAVPILTRRITPRRIPMNESRFFLFLLIRLRPANLSTRGIGICLPLYETWHRVKNPLPIGLTLSHMDDSFYVFGYYMTGNFICPLKDQI
jgi:hypothetical protein